MEGIIVIFDFDKTIIDVDSDNWVVDELGFTKLFDQLLPTMPWNTLMDIMMKEIHALGLYKNEYGRVELNGGSSIDRVSEVLTRVPIHPRVVEAIKAAHAMGCDLRVVSDANTFFIDTVLSHLGVRGYFSEIHTNPSFVDEQERLRILSHHQDFVKSSHGCCNPCPPNMCKGEVIKRILLEEANKKIIYLGDGCGDYCPSLKLRDGDHVMPRKNFPAWNLITGNPSLIKAKIIGWSDGAELEQVLLPTIQEINLARFLDADLGDQTLARSDDLLTKLPTGVELASPLLVRSRS